MKINTQNPQINFNKRLEAKASVIRDGKPLPCNIYSLDYDEDKLYFKNLSDDNNWEMGYFPEVADIDFTTPYTPYEFFAIEDNDANCLGYAEVLKKNFFFTKPEKKLEICLLETCPDFSKNNKFRKTKYIGETLLSFIVKKAKENNISKICVPTFAERAYLFYTKNCNFEDMALSPDRLVLQKSNYDSLLQQNEQHTGHHIELEV